MALSTIAPGFAQGAPALAGGWTAGPDSNGPNTYIGRIEAPRAGQSVAAGANLLVSGWAADTTAQGWSGFDQLQVYNGDRTKGGTKVADGVVGLNRPDVADALGGNFARSGFSATVPANALNAGAATLFIYLHTPNKGWWYRTLGVNQQAAVNLQFPTDPIVVILKPASDQPITTQQILNRYVIVGYALDRNPVTDPTNQSKLAGPVAGPGEAGIQSVTVYIDAMPGQAGYNPATNLVGNAGLGIEPLVDNRGPYPGPVHFVAQASPVTRAYGPQYEWAGWVTTLDTRNLQANAFHTVFAVARSSISGKTSMASSTFYLKQSQAAGTAPACSGLDLARHKGCAILGG